MRIKRSPSPVVIITGVSSGIGLATAKLMREQGWVVVGTIRKNKPAELAAVPIDYKVAEMTRPADLVNVVKETYRTYGRIDALVCNAGYGLLGPLETFNYDQMQRQVQVNFLAVAELVRLVLPIMRRQGEGVVVGLSSAAGRVGHAQYSIYGATKFALEGLFEALWHENQASGVRFRLIEPGPVKTRFFKAIVAGDKKVQAYVARYTKGRFGPLSAEHVARVILKSIISESEFRIHYPVGIIRWVLVAKKILPDSWFRQLVRFYYRKSL